MRFTSISFKLISTALAITTTVLVGVGFYGYEETKHRLAQDLENDKQRMQRRLELNLPGALWNFDNAYISSTLESEASAYFIQGIYVLNEEGELIDGIANRDGTLQKTEALPENIGQIKTTPLEFVDKDSNERNAVGKLAIETTDEKIRLLLEEEVKSIAIQIAILNVLLVFLFAIAIGRMARPLGALKTVAASIAEGNYDLDINIKRRDEIGELADSFNTMKTSIKKKVQDLGDLNATGEQLASSTTQVMALERALEALAVHCGVKYGSVFLFNDNNQLELASYFPPKQVESEQEVRRFADGEGVIGHAAKLSEIIYVPDTAKDSRFVPGFPNQSKALICVPLKDGEIPLGVLNLSGNIGDVKFEQTDYEYVETIARQLVTTVKNIRMRETIEEHNRTLEQKVLERTAELRQKNQDIQAMMQNMQQGLFTVVEDGKIHPEYSAFLERVFETSDIAGRSVIDLLFTDATLGSNELDQNRVAIESLLGEDEMMFDFNAHLLIKEYECYTQGKKKILSLDWNAIVNDGEISKLMVTVRDVTLLKELEAAAESQRRELAIVGQLLKLAPKKYLDFESSARAFIKENRAQIQNAQDKDEETLALLFRNMHTIKGNARTYGLVSLTDIVHDAENSYSELRKNPDAEWNADKLLAELAQVEASLDEYGLVFRQVLGRDDACGNQSAGALDAETIARIEACIAKVESAYPVIAEQKLLAPISHALNALNSVSIEEMLGDITGSLYSISKELGKANPQVSIQDNHLRMHSDAGDLMTSVFSHLLRNSIDHGIETPQERIAAGKPEQGHIELKAVDLGERVELRLRDDGKGINRERLFAKGVEKGLWRADEQVSNQAVAELIFDSGVSTKDAVSSISGRGVGMDAVRQLLAAQGGEITLELKADKSDSSFVPFETVIRLPKRFFSQG